MLLELAELLSLEFDELLSLEFDELLSLEFEELLLDEFDELLSLEFEELLLDEFDELLSLEFDELLFEEFDELLLFEFDDWSVIDTSSMAPATAAVGRASAVLAAIAPAVTILSLYFIVEVLSFEAAPDPKGRTRHPTAA